MTTPMGCLKLTYTEREPTLKVSANNFGVDEKELGRWLDYGARMYMPELGRWGVLDASSENYADFSPYSYVINNPVIAIDPDGNDVMLIPGGVRFTGSDAAAMFKTLQAASSSFIDQEFEDGHVQQRVTGYDFKATWKLTKVDKEGKGEWVEKYHFKMSISFQMTSEINFLSYKTGHYSFFGAKFSVMWSNNFFAYRKNDRIDYDNGRVMVSNPREPNMPGRWMDDRSPALNGSNIVVKGGLQTVSANIFQIGEGYNPFGKRSLTKYFNAQVPDFEFNADFVIQSKREWNEEYFSLFDQMNSLRKEIADDGDIPMPKGRKRLRRSK